jgi:parallel beta-helix repeat protein
MKNRYLKQKTIQRSLSLSVLCLVFIDVFLLFVYKFSFSYSPYNTHPALTEEMAEFFNFKAAGRESGIGEQEIKWLKLGSVREDKAPRWINHFYDPVHKTGWSGKHFGSLPEEEGLSKGAGMAPRRPLASIEWAVSQEFQSSYGRQHGNQTWQKAIKSYLGGDRKSAFIALGHILHLIEDLSVPDHARDDTHAGIYGDPGSPYEEYAKNYANYNKLDIAEDLISEGGDFFDFSDLGSAFEYLADYSNKNFFSEDTISNEEFEEPNISKLKIIKRNKINYFFDQNFDLYLAKINKDEGFIRRNKKPYTTDDKSFVLPSYRSHLFPQAVLAGASVINLFFKEAEKHKRNPELLEPVAPDSNEPFLRTLTRSPKIVLISASDIIDRIFTRTEVFFVKSGKRITESLSEAKLKIKNSFSGAASLVQSPLIFFNFQKRNYPDLKTSSPDKSVRQSAPDVFNSGESPQNQNANQAVETPSGLSVEAIRAEQLVSLQAILDQAQDQVDGISDRISKAALAKLAEARKEAGERKEKIRPGQHIQTLNGPAKNLKSSKALTDSYGLIPIPSGPEGAPLPGMGGGSADTKAQESNVKNAFQDLSFGGNGGEAEGGGAEGGESNQNSQEGQNLLDETPPDPPTIVSPFDFGQTFTTDQIVFEGEGEADAVLFAEIDSIIATTTISSDGGWSLSLDFSQGSTTIDFYAADEIGNKSSSTQISIFVDSIAPVVGGLTIEQCGGSLSGSGCLVATTTLNLKWSSSADDIDYYELSLPDGSHPTAAATITTTATSAVLALSDNAFYLFSLRAKDKAGNWSDALTARTEINTMPVVINEVAWGGTPGHPKDEFIELYNRASEAINLDNWVLFSQTDQKPWINLAGDISPGGYYLIERTDDGTVSDVPADWLGSFGASRGGGAGLSNRGETLKLVFVSANSTTTVDRTPDGKWPAGASNGPSMERIDPNVAGFIPGNWGTNALIANGKGAAPGFYNIRATPKARNSVNYLITQGSVLNEDKILTKSNSPYLIAGNLSIPQGKTLTVEPGVVVKIAGNSTTITVDGILDCRGSGEDPVVFTAFSDDAYGGDINNDATSTFPLPGSWKQVVLTRTSSSTFNNAIFRYGGMWYSGQSSGRSMVKVESATSTVKNSVFEYSKVYGLELSDSNSLAESNIFRNNGPLNGMGAGLYIQRGRPRVSNNTFQNNRYGIYISGSAAQIMDNNFVSNGAAVSSNGLVGSFSGNSGSNNGFNAIEITGSFTQKNSTTTLFSNGLPYVFSYSPTVAASSTLVIQPNTVIKSNSRLNVFGELFVRGANAGDVIFTSINDDSAGGDTQNNGTSTSPSAGDWYGISAVPGSYVSLEGATVKYGGARSFGVDSAGLNAEKSEVYLENVIFENNYLYGLRLENATSTIKNAEFKNHKVPANSSSAVAYFNSPIHLENVIFSDNALGVYADPNSIVKTVVNVVFNNNSSTTSPVDLW